VFEQGAAAYALPFAKQFDASIVLLHVVQPHVPVPEMSTVDVGLLEVELRESGTKQLMALKQTVGTEVPVETELRIGNPHLEIINAVGRLGIDLIVLSTHGRTGLAHVFMGSVAERVVRHASCPVLVVREEEREFLESTAAEADLARARESAGKVNSPARTGSLKRASLILACVLSLAATLSLGVAQSRRQRANKEFMRDKLELSQQVLSGLVTEDYDPSLPAHKLSAMREADWRVFENPEYDQHSIIFGATSIRSPERVKKRISMRLHSLTFA
jgi:nucleotide-binding universal stress UspA family protein